MMRLLACSCRGLAAFGAVACSSGADAPFGDDPSGPAMVGLSANESGSVPDGLWVGTGSNGSEMLLMISATGRAQIVEPASGLQGATHIFFGGDNTFGSYYWRVGEADAGIPDDWDFCGIRGTAEQRRLLTARITCESSDATVETMETVEFAYNDIYESGADFDRLAGIWANADPLTGDSLAVDDSGQLYSQGGPSACIYSGNLAVIDPRFDLYDVALTVEGCTGEAAELNGVSFAGFATVDDVSAVPATLLIAAVGAAAEGEEFYDTSLFVAYERVEY